ncbi:MAG: ParB/RepB/Spo0J family partition protein [Planctomycetota bacterium]
MAKDSKSKSTSSSKSSKPASKRRLGRGLSSLMAGPTSPKAGENASEAAPSADYVAETTESTPKERRTPVKTAADTGRPLDVPIEQIRPNPYQPRREFREDALAELAESIKQQGILQPLVVSRDGQDDAETPFILIAGERRLRAATLAGFKTVPVVLKQADQQQMLEWALIENIHRADLNAVEKAEAYRDYIDRFDLTQAAAAEKLGQPRATIANYLRILDLCNDAQQLVAQDLLSFGHAKVLAGLAGKPELQAKLARKAVAESLSVRKLEELMAAMQQPAKAQDIEKARPGRAKPAYIRDMEEQFRESIGTHVAINPGRRKHSGKIVIEYYSLDDFDRIASAFGLGDGQ